MKIALTTERLGPTDGIVLQMFQIGRELARRGQTIDLLFNKDGELRAEFASFCASTSKVPTFRSRLSTPSDFPRLVPGIRATRRVKPDVLYVSGHWELGFGVLSGMVTRAPFVCHLHMGLDPVEMRADSKIPRLAARARRLIACSSFVRDQFIEGGTDPEKIVTIHGGIALEDYPAASEGQRTAARQRLGLPEDAFVVLFLGRLDAAKGIEVLLEAWRELALPPRDARLLVVGSALFTDPEARARELQELAPPGCHFLPAQRDVVTPLQAADVQVAPSLWEEPFGRVVVEGLAAGLPVVSSRSGGIVEIFDGHDELGQQLLCAPGSVEELCEKIQFLKGWRTHDPALAQRCARVAARFDIETMVDRVEEVLNDAVA